MKKITNILLLSACALLGAASASAQWAQQASGTTEDLTGVRFVNADTGFACGAYNTLIRTTDGGESWQAVGQGQIPSCSYTAMDALSESHVFVARIGLYATEDGGLTWNEWGSLSSYSGSVLAMKVLSDSTALVMKNGAILKTSNKGADWTVLYSANHLAGPMQFTGSNDTAYAAAGISYDGISVGTIHKSVDGGNTWTDLGMISPQITAMHFINALTGWYAAFGNTMYHTTDGAINWTAISSPVQPDSDYITAVHFLDDATGYVGTYKGFIYKTQDGGASWTVEHTGHQTGGNYDRPISSLAALDGARMLSVGNTGTVLKSDASTGILQTLQHAVRIYPNPATDLLNIDAGNDSRYTRLLVYDVAGRVRHAQDIQGLWQVRLDMSRYGSGLYVVALQGSGKPYRQCVSVR